MMSEFFEKKIIKNVIMDPITDGATDGNNKKEQTITCKLIIFRKCVFLPEFYDLS